MEEQEVEIEVKEDVVIHSFADLESKEIERAIVKDSKKHNYESR